jgi:hypothetical protein
LFKNRIFSPSAVADCSKIEISACPPFRIAKKSKFQPIRRFGLLQNRVFNLSLVADCSKTEFLTRPTLRIAQKYNLLNN